MKSLFNQNCSLKIMFSVAEGEVDCGDLSGQRRVLTLLYVFS